MLRERRFDTGLFGLGDGLALVAGIVLAVSAFTGWYTGEGEGVTISALAWNTGTLGKLVLFVGLAVVLIVELREAGVETPAAVPQSLMTIALGAIGTVFDVSDVLTSMSTLTVDGESSTAETGSPSASTGTRSTCSWTSIPDGSMRTRANARVTSRSRLSGPCAWTVVGMTSGTLASRPAGTSPRSTMTCTVRTPS